MLQIMANLWLAPGEFENMHEMSLAMSILQLAEEEAAKNGCNRLSRICVSCGALSGAMPEALEFCLKCLLAETAHKDAILELAIVPVKLRCAMCQTVFEGVGQGALWQPCPKCGEIMGHGVEQGRELVLSRIEACHDENLPMPK